MRHATISDLTDRPTLSSFDCYNAFEGAAAAAALVASPAPAPAAEGPALLVVIPAGNAPCCTNESITARTSASVSFGCLYWNLPAVAANCKSRRKRKNRNDGDCTRSHGRLTTHHTYPDRPPENSTCLLDLAPVHGEVVVVEQLLRDVRVERRVVHLRRRGAVQCGAARCSAVRWRAEAQRAETFADRFKRKRVRLAR